MVIIRVSGGLGNQMFQYALYQEMLHRGREAKLDLSSYEEKQNFRQFELDLFGLDYEVASLRECARLGECSYSPADKLRRKLFGKRKSYYEEALDQGYQPEIFDRDPVYLDGYWQCEKYFKDIRRLLLEKFSFPQTLCVEGQKLLDKIRHTEAVSLHVRRGDYLDAKNFHVYGDICTKAYYQNAIRWIRQNCENPVFYLFTNDTEWVKNEIWEPGMELIGPSEGKKDYEDMFLMSQCRHNIVANSSFSWWGAWLNQHGDKKVLAPRRWFHHYTVSDAICEDWIRIEYEK